MNVFLKEETENDDQMKIIIEYNLLKQNAR